MSKCTACGKFMGRAENIGCKCTKCGSIYHRACVAIGASVAVPPNWTCPECKCPLPRDNNCETPVKGLHAEESCPSEPSEMEPVVDMAQELRLFRLELASMRRELAEFGGKIDGVTFSLRAVNEKVDELTARVDAVETKVARGGVSEATRVLEEAVMNLQMELSDRDQDMLLGDVQISNIPEQQGESVEHLVSVVSVKLGVTLDERDVVFAERAGPRRAEGERPRPITVRLARRATRAELLRAARVRRTATTADMGLAGEPQRFYINERLTKLNRMLFRATREQASLAGWKYVWTRDGRVYARRAESQPVHRIRREFDIANIFRNVTVSL